MKLTEETIDTLKNLEDTLSAEELKLAVKYLESAAGRRHEHDKMIKNIKNRESD